MVFAILVVVLLGLMYLPSLWVRHVLKKHSAHRDDFPGNGADMAHHLINLMALGDVKVEITEHGDHYDPSDKAVRLTEDKYQTPSLTGVVVAAHEVGHAIQDHQKESLFQWRSAMAWVAMLVNKLAPVLLLAAPALAIWNPAFSRWSLVAAIASVLVGVLLNLITLPVEWDASFGKALPMLEAGQYLSEQDMRAARQILLAAALTYVAASLASLLNLGTLLRVLRR